MNKPIDLTIDWLSSASLTPDQRCAWDLVREELGEARAKIVELESKVNELRRQVEDVPGDHVVLSRPDFNREVARMLAFDERYGGISSVLYVDVENLEEIIKTEGASVGGSVVQIICDTLSKQIRTSDIVGRLAANEFGVLLVRCDNPNAWKKGEILASKLQSALAQVEGHKLTPVISYGAYTFQEKEDVAKGIKNAASSVTHSY